MTQVDFHFNVPDKLDYACRLLRKIRRSGLQAVVYCPEPGLLQDLDRALWRFDPVEFIPHVMHDDPLAARTPVVLSTQANEAPHHDVLVNLGGGLPAFFSRFPRLVELVGIDAADRQEARERFRHYRDRGYALKTHEVQPPQPA